MRNKILFLLLTLFASASLYAKPVISGKLTDKESSKPVEFATIELLLLPDSTHVDAVTSNAQGVFIFEKGDSTHKYCLRIKHLSYKTAVVPVVKKGNGPFINMGSIPMEAAVIGMKEVVVNGAKILVTELPDKTVYAVSEGIIKSSVDGIDVLRKVPSVQIDYFNEDIKVEGKSNIVIEVDGVTRSKDYLKKLHPKQIEKFEINTTPSGKYDPETDAVINIITNPAMRYGLKGMVVGQVIPNPDSYQGYMNANLDYGLEKITYYIGGYGGLSNFGFLSNTHRKTSESELFRYSDNTNKGSNIYLNSGFNYDPNKLNTFSFNLSYNRNASDGDGEDFNKSFKPEKNEIYKTISNSDRNNSGINTSLYYKHKFDKDGKHNIEFDTRYSNSLNSNSKTKFYNIYYAEDEIEELYRDNEQGEENKTNSQSANLRASYTLPFDSVYILGAGINGNYNVYDLENISSASNAPNLDYEDFRSAGYVDLSRSFKKGSAKIGSRFETSNITINSKDKSEYFSFLPYANAQYKFNAKQNARLSYTRRVIRPSTYDLNPFVSRNDGLTVTHGNIHLKPAYRDYFQFSYSYRYSKGKYAATFSPQVFYEYKTKIIKRIYRDLGDGRVENLPENISNGYDAGAGISVNLQLSKVMVNSYFRYVNSHVDSYQDQIVAVNKEGWNWNMQVMSPLFYKINFMSFFNMSSPSIDGQDEYRSKPMYYLGLRRQVMQSGSIMVMAINPFGDYINKSTTIKKNDALYQRTESHMNLRNAFIVTFTYNFKAGKEINVQKNNAEQEDNKMPLSF